MAGAAIPGGGDPSGGLAGAVPQDKVFSIAAVKVEPRKIFRRLELAFKDGTSTTVDRYRANSPDAVQQAGRAQ
ncbi:MAG: hypothetical protein M3Y77_22615 [Actinomycetota bacterium]|nr:hypothetical protein [Actinomycetota bacterium]